MIESFLQSWSLFGTSYLAALAASVLLSIVGVGVVARGQVFAAAAVSQAALLGVALSLVFKVSEPAILAVAASVLASLAATRRARPGGTTAEEVTAWIFLGCSSVSILLLSGRPVSLNSVQAMLASSIIGATRDTAALFSVLAFVVLFFVLGNRRRLTLFLADPTMASAVGVPVQRWNLFLGLALGLAAGLGMKTLGAVFTFGCLVLPALIAKTLLRETSPILVAAPIIAVTGVLTGLVGANQYDLPPGQVVVALLCTLLALAWCVRWIRGRLVGSRRATNRTGSLPKNLSAQPANAE